MGAGVTHWGGREGQGAAAEGEGVKVRSCRLVQVGNDVFPQGVLNSHRILTVLSLTGRGRPL